MKRIPLKSCDEYDALTSWRRVMAYVQRSGVKKAIRKQYNKRFRKAVKVDTQKQLSE